MTRGWSPIRRRSPSQVGTTCTPNHTQHALAEALGIAQQTLGHYEVERARIAADLLPRLAEALDLSLDELLIGQPTIRIPGKRGLASRLEQQIDAITRLPKAKQKMVAELIDSVVVKAQMEAAHATG